MTEAELDQRCRDVLVEIQVEIAKATDVITKARWRKVEEQWRKLLRKLEPRDLM
jgi:hypothetical protein